MAGFCDVGWGAGLLDEGWGLTHVVVRERLQTFPSRFVERISSDQGGFAVKVDRDPGAVVEGSERVQSAVAAALPAHVPAIRPDRGGRLSAVERGCRITVHEDIAGGRPAAGARTWGALGAVLARMHALPPAPRPFAIPVAAAADELDRAAAGYPFAAEFRALTPRVRRIGGRPAATVHGEVNLANVRQRPSGELALLDWDSAGAGPIALDLGYPLICVFHGEDLSWWPDRAAAFYSAYAEHRAGAAPLPSPERIVDAALMHAMRYVGVADTAARWRRITCALRREGELLDLLGRALAPGGGVGAPER